MVDYTQLALAAQKYTKITPHTSRLPALRPLAVLLASTLHICQGNFLSHAENLHNDP